MQAAIRPVCVALLLAVMACGPGCNSRERTNPLDPANLTEEPNPWVFRAIAGDREVSLEWTALVYQDLHEVVIERRHPVIADSVYASHRAPVTAEGFVDAPVENGRSYDYYFLPELDDGRTVSPVGPITVTPGPEVCWVANTGSMFAQVLQLAPDGREAGLRLGGFRSPNDISVATVTGQVWVADTGHARVVALDRDGNHLFEVGGFTQPKSVSALPDGSVWVADEGMFQQDGALVRLAADGSELTRIGDFSRPVGVSARAADGSAWMSDATTGIIWRFSASGAVLARVEDSTLFQRPLELDVVESDGSVWVTDDHHEAVVHLGPDGEELLRLGMQPDRPFGIAVNQQTDQVWISMHRAGTVEKRGPDGDLLLTVDGFASPLGIDVNSIDGSVWVADEEEVVKIFSAGRVLARFEQVVQPFAVSVDPRSTR